MELVIRPQLEGLVGKRLYPNILNDYDLICHQDYSEPLSPITILKTGPIPWKDSQLSWRQHEQGFKRPCIFLCRDGVCKHGEQCQYSHAPEQCNHFHEIWHNYIEGLKEKGIYARKPCKQFIAGYCHKGDYCTFKH